MIAPLYHSERGLWPFQAEHTAIAALRDRTLLNWDAGLGKSHAAMAMAALLLEDDLVDVVLLVCERNKMVDEEWPKELNKYTDIDWIPYEGTVAKRKKLRAGIAAGDHQLYLASYDIIKQDAVDQASWKNAKGNETKPQPGPLLDCLDGKRVFLVYDETTRIANRKSKNHKAHKLLVDILQEQPGFRILALTATPMEKDPQNFYNLGRIFSPQTTPSVEVFEEHYVSSYNIYGDPSRFKNLNESEIPDKDGNPVPPLKNIMGGITLRKRKTDRDVIDFFPKRRELPTTFVTLDPSQAHFYSMVAELTDGLSDWESRMMSGVLRQIAGHPASLLYSEGAIAKAIVETVTPEGLRRIPSSKTLKMVEWADTVVRDQGAQAVIFTFYAQSVLPLLAEALEGAGYSVTRNHGGMSQAARSAAQKSFRAGETQIFLTSDIGQRGVNLPEATYLLHYERPLTHAQFIQRSDRIHRIDSLAESVFIYSLVAGNTIEEGLYQMSLQRNDWHDKLTGDDECDDPNFITAEDRKQLLKIGRKLNS